MKTVRRRRAERKTDYKLRLGLLKSGKRRLVIRKTNRYITAQIVESDLAQDKVVIGITSKSLLEYGWERKGKLKNRAAAYLTGYALGKKAAEMKIKNAILDIGMHRNIHKSRIYAVLRGAIDAGLDIPHDKNALPDDEMLKKGEYAMIEKIKEKI